MFFSFSSCSPFLRTIRASMTFVPTTYWRVMSAFNCSGSMSAQRWCFASGTTPPQYSIPRCSNLDSLRSILDTALRENALLVCVFYLAHFGYGVGQIHQQGMCIAPGQDYMHHLWLGFQCLGYFCRI